MRAAHLGRGGKQTRHESDTSSRRRRTKGVSQTLVVDQPGAELQIRGQRPEGVDRVSDLVNDLGSEQAESAKNQVTWMHTAHFKEGKEQDATGCKKGRTLHLSGISPKASGRRTLSVVCTMAAVIETPQTVPRERMR